MIRFLNLTQNHKRNTALYGSALGKSLQRFWYGILFYEFKTQVMTEQYKIDTVAIILAEMLKESRKDNITKGEFHKLPNNYAERIVKLFAIPDVVCSCCGKNTPEICGSCVSDIAQGTAEQAIDCR